MDKEMTYKGYNFKDYLDDEADNLSLCSGVYYTLEDLWDMEQDNFKDWVDEKEK